MTTETQVRLYFASGMTHDMPYTTDYPILGLDIDGRVVVDQASVGMGTFGLTLCCDAFDKGYADGVFCRACGGMKGDDTGSYNPVVVDAYERSVPWLPVPGHINDVTEKFCRSEGTLALNGRCPSGCDHADHYANDGHPECEVTS